MRGKLQSSELLLNGRGDLYLATVNTLHSTCRYLLGCCVTRPDASPSHQGRLAGPDCPVTGETCDGRRSRVAVARSLGAGAASDDQQQHTANAIQRGRYRQRATANTGARLFLNMRDGEGGSAAPGARAGPATAGVR